MGGGTLLVSLPREWARKNGVTKGATLAVEEISNGRLMVRPIEAVKGPVKETVVEYPGEGLSYLINDLTGAYLLGYHIIRIQGRRAMSREHRERLKSSIGRLIGLEIIEEDSRNVTLQFLLEPTALNPEKLARRMAGIVEGMMKDTSEGMLSSDLKLLASVEERDDEVDRLYFLLVRTIRTATIDPEVAERYGLAPLEVLDYRVLASSLESVGDTIAEFSKKLTEALPDRRITKQLARCIEHLGSMQDLSMRSFMSRRGQESRGVYVEIDELSDEITELLAGLTESAREKTPLAVELVGLMERASKIFVDISDLALPSYRLR